MNPVETVEAGKAVNPLKELLKYGQSVWLDYIRRNLITSGELKRLIDEDGLRGMTSNPSIFEKAIAGSTDYTDFLEFPEGQNRPRCESALRTDCRSATSRTRPTSCARSTTNAKRNDGYVSLEVSPYLAQRHAGHDRRGAPSVEGRRPRQRDDQGSGHAGRHCRRSSN